VILHVRVKPGSSKPGFSRENDEIVLRVRERAIEGAANTACIEEIAKEYGVPKSRVTLVRGAKSKQKVFEIAD
jgi:uncharacterized protein